MDQSGCPYIQKERDQKSKSIYFLAEPASSKHPFQGSHKTLLIYKSLRVQLINIALT